MTGSVLTIGTFDGVHRGHQQILHRVAALARRTGLSSVVVAFERPPRHHFHPPPEPSLLTSPAERAALLRCAGIDRVVFLEFNQTLSRVSAASFYARTLRRRFRAKHVVVGYDFAFGCDRAGNVDALRHFGADDGLRVHTVAAVRGDGETISSGRLRRLVSDGSLVEARALLGRFYSLSAPVVRGRGQGRHLGFPTANLDVPEFKIVPHGVTLVRVLLPSGLRRMGLCNHGVRPTLPGAGPSTEVHVIDYEGDLRGQDLQIEFIRLLRPERRFPTTSALAAQIRRDEVRARRYGREFLP